MNDFRLLVAIPSLYNPANYGRFSVCFLSPGVSYPPVYGRRFFVHREHRWGNHMGKYMGSQFAAR